MKIAKVQMTRIMKINNTTLKNIETWQKLYFDSADIIRNFYKKNYNLDIDNRYIWRVALDRVCNVPYKEIFNTNKGAAYKQLSMNTIKKVCKIIISYKDPVVFNYDMIYSDKMRMGDSKYNQDLISKEIKDKLQNIVDQK